MAIPNICRKGFILATILVFLFTIENLTFAETKVFVEEYTYQASEADSKLSSRGIALEQVKRLLLEKLGTYLDVETEVKNFQLTKDQIVILTAGIVRAEIIDEKWDGKTYSLKAKIAADPKEVIKSIDLLRQDRQKTKELEETRKNADDALKEVEKLKRALEIAKAGKTEQAQYNEAIKRLSATDWFENGYALGLAGRHQEAIRAFTMAIELNPKYALAYFARGAAYGFKLTDYRQAIRDYDKAIEIEPKLALAYSNRGLAYDELGDYRQAIRDYDQAIQLNPKEAIVYLARGNIYRTHRDYRQAINDFDRAIELDPENAKAYSDRGSACVFLEDYRRAIGDLDRAIELDPKDSRAYSVRGATYLILGDWPHAHEDYKIAARLGNKQA